LFVFGTMNLHSFSQNLITATFNIRLQTIGDSGNLWSHGKYPSDHFPVMAEVEIK